MAYATDTSVPVEKSRMELERILQKYGATEFAYMSRETAAMIGFSCKGKAVRFILPLPNRDAEVFWNTPGRGTRRKPEDAYKHWEQACRTKWRALCLCVKAKLEAVESNITSFEAEFLAHFVMPNGQVFGEIAIPRINEAAERGQMPPLNLGFSQ
jgi:hypothetical protein